MLFNIILYLQIYIIINIALLFKLLIQMKKITGNATPAARIKTNNRIQHFFFFMDI